MTHEHPRCDQCTYWVMDKYYKDDLHPDDRTGTCHRRAPAPIAEEIYYEILRHLTTLAWQVEQDKDEYKHWEEAASVSCSWPHTLGEDWCGEHVLAALPPVAPESCPDELIAKIDQVVAEASRPSAKPG